MYQLLWGLIGKNDPGPPFDRLRVNGGYDSNSYSVHPEPVEGWPNLFHINGRN